MPCSTLIVGKAASMTGRVIVGHNEDDITRTVVSRYRVPRLKHRPGEMLTFEEGRASIPQVKETWSYIWSEIRQQGGSSFSDCFFNEWGLAVVTNRCRFSREDEGDLSGGGIGYGLRRLVAERARTAREALDVAVDLVERYGYFDSGRSYTFADRQEAWVLQVVQGKRYAALRVPDDEVAFIPNHYTIRHLDPQDPGRCRCSPDLVEYATRKGWYRSEEGVFDFARAYQDPGDRGGEATDYNRLRQEMGLRLLTGKYFGDDEILPFSTSPRKKLGVDQVRAVLRSHYEGTVHDRSEGYGKSPHFTGVRVMCIAECRESSIVEFQDSPELTTLWLSTGRACLSPFVPWYLGMDRVPEGFADRSFDEAQRDHFRTTAQDLDHDPGQAWWAFKDLEELVDPQYDVLGPEVQARRDELEAAWVEEKTSVDREARRLMDEDTDEARRLLTGFSCAKAREAWDSARELFDRFNTVRLSAAPKDLSRDEPDAHVEFVLYGGQDLDPADVVADTIRVQPDFPLLDQPFAQPVEVVLEGEGKARCLKARFRVGDLLEFASDSLTSFWFTAGTKEGRKVVGRDLVRVRSSMPCTSKGVIGTHSESWRCIRSAT